MSPAMLLPFPRNPLVYLVLDTGRSMMVGTVTLGVLGAPGGALPRAGAAARGRARPSREGAPVVGLQKLKVTLASTRQWNISCARSLRDGASTR